MVHNRVGEAIWGTYLCPAINTVQNRATGTGPDGAVALSSANGLVGTGFAFRYRLKLRAGFLEVDDHYILFSLTNL